MLVETWIKWTYIYVKTTYKIYHGNFTQKSNSRLLIATQFVFCHWDVWTENIDDIFLPSIFDRARNKVICGVESNKERLRTLFSKGLFFSNVHRAGQKKPRRWVLSSIYFLDVLFSTQCFIPDLMNWFHNI